MSEEIKKELEILWTPQQVAKYLGLHTVTVYRWIAEKRMLDQTKIVRFSNRVRIPRSEVERIAGITRAKLMSEVAPETEN
ncbi:MAG: helix-turn-helix domain-containing protein [Candidatus Colwellbacteria bacterium]